MTKAMKKLEVLLKRMPDHGNLIQELVEQHVEEIIGEDEKGAAVYADYTANSEHFRNELRTEQREKAGLRD